MAFGLAALWPHTTPWARWHGEHHCGVTLGADAGGVWVQAQPVGLDHSTPTLLLSGGRCSLLTLVLFPAQLPGYP